VERIGHYTIVSELGRGGMGVVYKAHEESLNRFVAIKMLGEHLSSDDEYVQRFVREARSAAALSHPNIVQIFAISEDNGRHYFVMEFVQGTSVERLIRDRRKLGTVEAARLILQAASGLEAAHAQGVIHRDIKPANLMVNERGLVKIADFGLALMGSATTRLTATGMLMGTPGYLSPEQCLDQGPDHRTDIYSLGVTFFEMVTGTMPFRADSPLALLKLIVEVAPPDVGELNPEVDPELRGIIARMLAKDREQRYASCTEIITALQGWLASRGEPLHSTTDGRRTVVPPPPPPPAMTEDEINTQPTVMVPSGATDQPAPSPPPPAGPAATEPAPRATAPSTQPPSTQPPSTQPPSTQPPPAPARSRAALIAVAVVLFLLASAIAAVVITVKSGLLDRVMGSGPSKIAAVDGEGPPTGGDRDRPAPAEAASPTGKNEPGSTVSGQVREDPGSAATSTAAASSANRTKPASSPPKVAGKTPAGVAGPVADPVVEPVVEPPVVAAPVELPTGTVVLATGERLLAVEAESYLKMRLEQAGVEVVELTSIPGLEGLHDTEARPTPEELREALRPYARYLVGLRVEYLGDRPVSYLGQPDVVYASRVNIGLVDLAEGRPLGKPTSVRVEYTQLNVEQRVGKELGRVATGLVQTLPRH
jgi:serine/threonine-protein kinase